jgi:putative acetyltransferase
MYARQFRHVLSDLTVAVAPAFEDHGVGTALFETLFAEARRLDPPITRIELFARSGNAAAIELYKRPGFAVEGRSRARVTLDDGTIEDDIPMGKLL